MINEFCNATSFKKLREEKGSKKTIKLKMHLKLKQENKVFIFQMK